MALSQGQIIQSLGEALAWFEKELAWGVRPAELGHLTGRIGELYAAMITRGQMALATHQRGYDVVSADGERISVKTATSATHLSFKKSTFHHVDRVLILRLTVDEQEAAIEELLDCPAANLPKHTTEGSGEYVYRVRQAPAAARPPQDLPVVSAATHGDYRVIQYENGTVMVERQGVFEPEAKPVLRKIAAQIGVSLLNMNGNERNTRQLGAEVLAVLNANAAAAAPADT